MVWDLKEAECDRKPLRWIKVQLPLLKQRARTKILNCHPDLAFSFPNRFAIPTAAQITDSYHRRTRNAILDGIEYRSLT